ncbi:sigma D regulator [Gammaproteobacteria bacterium]|nr:sigma D regulator [Gammaproteobacteria bacterium]
MQGNGRHIRENVREHVRENVREGPKDKERAIADINSRADIKDAIIAWRKQRELLNQSLEDNIFPNSPNAPIKNTSSRHQLISLCDELIDYISIGHFRIYEKLLQQGIELASGKILLVKNIYHTLGKSTDYVLGFNDKYDNNCHFIATKEGALPKDLLKLNTVLSIRFLLEEQLIKIMNNECHQSCFDSA